MATVAIIDGDEFAYKAAASSELEVDWGGGFFTLSADMQFAAGLMESHVREAAAAVKADSIVLAFTDPLGGNWRRMIYNQYKMNRNGKRKPTGYPSLVRAVGQKFAIMHRPGLEGDDIIGMLGTHDPEMSKELGISKSDTTVMISSDKDMRGVPGYLYNPSKPEEGQYLISEDMADHFHLLQALMGDVSDGYPGCPGIGPKTAAKLLSGKAPEEYWPIVVDTYNKAGFSEEYALVQARVAHILRAGEYIGTGRVRYWNPKEKHAS